MRWMICMLSAAVLLSAQAARSQETTPLDAARLRALALTADRVRVVAPAAGAEVVAKRPEFRVEFTEAPAPGTFMILLDGSDVTPLARVEGNLVVGRAPLALAPGEHRFEVVTEESSRGLAWRTVKFNTRHSAAFKEATSATRLAGSQESIVERPEGGEDLPTSTFEAIVSTENRMKNPGAEFALLADLQYRDRELNGTANPGGEGDPILDEGLFPVSYLARAAFTAGGVRTEAEVGTLEINETEFTVDGLGSRGGRLAVDQKYFAASVFSLDSRNLTRFKDGIGIGGGSENRVLGGTVSLRLPARLELKGIYLTGGTDEDSLGIADTDAPTEGNLLGAVLTTDFFQGVFRTEFEYAASEYDPDTADDLGAKRDRAWRVGAGGAVSRYNWQAAYEHLGPDYASVGNPNLQRDRAGYRLGAGATLGGGNLTLGYAQHRDNVEDEDLFPRITDTEASVNWSYTGFAAFPISLGYQRHLLASSREPEDVLPLDQGTGTFTGSVAYTGGRLNVGLQASHSIADDRSEFDNDVTATTYALTPSWRAKSFTVTPSAALITSVSQITDVTSSNALFGLALRAAFWKEAVTFEAAGTYGINKADDDSLDSRESRADVRLTVAAGRLFRGFFAPAVSLRAQYADIKDKLDPTADKDTVAVYLVVTAAVPLSF